MTVETINEVHSLKKPVIDWQTCAVADLIGGEASNTLEAFQKKYPGVTEQDYIDYQSGFDIFNQPIGL